MLGKRAFVTLPKRTKPLQTFGRHTCHGCHGLEIHCRGGKKSPTSKLLDGTRCAPRLLAKSSKCDKSVFVTFRHTSKTHKSPANIEMSHLSRLSRLKSPSRRKPHDKTRRWSCGPVVPWSRRPVVLSPALIRSFPALSVVFDFFGLNSL